jgi:hypothetical protein
LPNGPGLRRAPRLRRAQVLDRDDGEHSWLSFEDFQQKVCGAKLRYARAALDVDTVRTHHNARNLPMIAIDRKLGYVQSTGLFLMVKSLST